MSRITRHLVATTSAASLLLLAGCGAAAEKASEKATEQMVESQTGGDVDIDSSDGSVQIETEDGTISSDGEGNVEIETEDGSFSSSGSGEVPASWPEDVPLPAGLTVQVGSEQDASDGRLVSIIGTTTDSPEEVLATLKEALADWEISGEVTTTGNDATTTGAQWEIDGRRFNFSATTGMGSEDTALTYSHTTLAS